MPFEPLSAQPIMDNLSEKHHQDQRRQVPYEHQHENHQEPQENQEHHQQALPSQQDLDQIWNWNASVPDQVQGCVHDLISKRAAAQPDRAAVCAWDGDLTYAQLDALASEVARRLVELRIPPRSIVPILFSKSRWTCVAMLGVIKAGCSVVALDATHPDSRLRSIIAQTRPRCIISSAAHHTRASLLATNVSVFQLDEGLLEVLDAPIPSERKNSVLPVVSPSDLVYISFTSFEKLLTNVDRINLRLSRSGTTGQPKGACISHANVRSSVLLQGSKLGFHSHARVFDFAPYSFDVAWSNFLHTLCAGGCLCIASEQDMLNDLSAAITAFAATLINVTPTALRTISPIPPTLESVLLSGEMPYRQNVTQWAGRVRLLNTYGPTECTFKCAFSVLSPAQEGRPDIGTGVGFATWLVHPDDGDRLVPVGAVGELCLEGPMVGQGYLSDPDKTASAFINDPAWLLAGSSRIAGRRGRLYKTGDLVRYKPDGRLLFIGRKDASQLKIRGQRIEIGDVEHHARACLDDALQIIVDVVRPRGSDSSSLALFVLVKQHHVTQRVKTLLDGLSEKLREVLPTFMIPSIYFPIEEIPVASTGKVDRRRLREMGSALSWREIVDLQSTIVSAAEYCEPSTETEQRLCQIWAEILDLETTRISTTDSFLRLGGDSISAMRVVAAAREIKMSLTVAQLFTYPLLGELAQLVTQGPTDTHVPKEIRPFSLLSGVKDRESICREASRLCGVGSAYIEDVFPCTPLQQGMLAMTSRNEGDLSRAGTNYVSRTAYELSAKIDLGRLERAWVSTVERASILRTRIIDLSGEGLVQVVVQGLVPCGRYTHMNDYLLDHAEPMGLGSELCRAAIVEGTSRYFVLEMHHAIFDGWSTALILDAVEDAYRGEQKIQPLVPFQPFIKHVLSSNKPEAAAFWRRQLADSEAALFPSPDYRPGEKLDVNHPVSGLRWPRAETTPSTIVRSALALLLASYTNSSDVKYGATVSGRQAAVARVEQIAGPTIATVPVRVRFDWDQTVQQIQQQIQQQAVEMTEHEQFGLQNIQRIDPDVQEASNFQLLLVIQPPQRATSQDVGGIFTHANTVVTTPSNGKVNHGEAEEFPQFSFVTKDGQADGMGHYNSYALMIICQLEDSGLTLKMNFDSGAIKPKSVQRFAQQLEHLLRQLCAEPLAKSKLRDITAMSDQDLVQVREWNKVLPKAAEDLVTELVDRRAAANAENLAISSWDQNLTYRELRDKSRRLAHRLSDLGVGSGSVVVLSMDKSSWLVVYMLSLLKIGAIALPLSTSVSSQRALEIVEALQPKLAITSHPPEASSFHKLIQTLTISELDVKGDRTFESSLETLEHPTQPSDPALVLFTSGSTGAPKSILWSHETLSSNIRAASTSFGITEASRVFQFAGYEFDVSTVEALATLSVGGVLCIPSEADRSNRLAGAINDSNANWLCLTPSVSETLAPAELPSLRTLVFAGEKLQHSTAFRWTERLDSVYNWYGPAEASVASSYVVKEATWKAGIIGQSTSGVTWLVDPKNPNALAPIGAVAELCIEGPILASYVGPNGSSMNDISFLRPPWLERGQVYRTGDLVTYDTDGSIVFIGRRQDSQRKLRGQRVELSEIEARVQSFLSGKLDVMVVAEIFTPSNSKNGSEALALFISPLGVFGATDDSVGDLVKKTMPTDELETYLTRFLPSYMIPRIYIPVTKMPTTHSGKTDRRRLRQIGGSLTYEQLAAMQPQRKEAREPSTDMEKWLQRLWAEIIGIDADSIHANGNFLRLGGDSITAMRLVASARHQGLLLSVADVFASPQLEHMAKLVRLDSGSPEQEVLPFSLLYGDGAEAESRFYAARLCSIPESRVVDVYPCTALQQGLLALGSKKHGQYVSRSVLGLQADIDPHRLQRAWLAVVDKMAVLRTRIVDMPGQGLVQVVVDENPLRSGVDVDAYLREDEREPMGLGTELCRAAIIGRNFVFTIHHCTYDGNTLKMILDEVESQYLQKPGMAVTPFRNFIHHLGRVGAHDMAKFWKGHLAVSEPRQFPSLPSSTYEPKATEILEHSIALHWPRNGITPSTIIRSAWALLAAQYTSSSNVIFGLTVSGRQADMRGLESCVGPTISTVPVAVSIDWDETVDAFLGHSQRQMTKMTPYEQYGLHNIQRLHGDLDPSVMQTLLVVQPVAEGKSLDEDSLLFKARSFSSNLATQGNDPFNNYALMLICELAASGLHLRLSFDANIIDKRQMRCIALQYETVIRQMCVENAGQMKLNAIQTVSDDDLALLWTQNAQPPEETQVFVHDQITLAASKQADVVAIDAWDGQFTYNQVEELSTRLCQALIMLGVSKGSVVALCFEKSKWTPVTQIAVLKAGAVSLLQSTAVPDQRVGLVFNRVGVQLAVVSECRRDVVSQYVSCFTVHELMEMATPLSMSAHLPVPALAMSDPAAILVSSGSTGEPKQILWSHRALAANVKGHGECLSVDATVRTFQFASHDFDAATTETLSTLAHMGCVCIPSESERLDGLSAAITRYSATSLNVTPSTAKLIHPDDVASLQTIILVGESVLQEDVDRWKGRCRVINWYGPAECSSATFCDAGADEWHSGVIGWTDSKHASLCWLVDPRNHDRLVPFGAVGEIVLEGPACSDGYVGNAALTERLFLDDPAFLSSGHGTDHPGRHGRIYCTGDLARFNSDGSLVVLGRKDAQVKIRGQLVAPAEVQFHIRNCLSRGSIQVVVDAIRPKNGTNLVLVAFISPVSPDEVEELTVGLHEKLKARLPSYAIPSFYIPLSTMPTTPTGKRDRTRLLEIGASFEPPRRASGSEWRDATTTAERTLRTLWSLVLGLDADSISTTDSFLRLGDSIQAMRLVGVARQQGLALTVADIFAHPLLIDMAKELKSLTDGDEDKDDSVRPFTLLSDVDLDLARQQAAAQCGVETDDIQDLFPCTPLQEGLLALTMKRQGDYTGHNVLKLAPTVDVARFKAAWEKVVLTMPILRTRIVSLPGQRLVQAVVRVKECWTAEHQQPIGLGSPLMRCGSISETETETSFSLTMHHSIYDGPTMALILESLESAYHGAAPLLPPCPFQSFVRYLGGQDDNAHSQFWQSQLAGLEAAPFPILPSSTYQPQTDCTLTHSIDDVSWRAHDDNTPSTVIRAALSLVLSQYSSSTDVVFGTVVAGRRAPVVGIERVVGPTIATVPIRVRIDKGVSVSKWLAAMQSQATNMVPHEQAGLSAISRASEEARQACQFQTLLVVQPGEQSIAETSLFVQPEREKENHRYHSFSSYALSLICTMQGSQLRLEFCFDSSVIESDTVGRMAQHFEQLLRTLCSPAADQTAVGNVSMMTHQDLSRVWEWNAQVPESIERCMHHLITQVAQAQPDAVAISAWDGEVTYGVLDQVSDHIAGRLVEFGVRRNMIIPLCFEKSLFAMIALLSVIKAGGAGLLLDPALPEARLSAMVKQAEPVLILSSPSNSELSCRLVPKTFIVDSTLVQTASETASSTQLPFVDPSDLLYVIFTSGSTGTPKGCLMQHRNFVSAVTHQRALLKLDQSSRMYDFSSYTFDASYWSLFHVLAAGGTLCVPGETERKSSLTDSLNRFRATDVFLTPSTARTVDVTRVKTLRHVHLGGEEVTRDDVARWMPHATPFVSYGPAECSAGTAYYEVPHPVPARVSIGRGAGVSAWVVDPRSSERLSPLGMVGELYLEGPLVGLGYLGDEEKTASSFVQDPPWLVRGGRRGRLYKTGDLVKYNPADGTLVFIGRKDTQVKLRGQRIELSEVEHHVRRCLADNSLAIAEVILPSVTKRPTLCLFIQADPAQETKFSALVDGLERDLRHHLPAYMVPSVYIPLGSIPLAVSGKADRRRLRDIGAGLTLEQLAGRGPSRAPGDERLFTDAETALARLWVSVLGVPQDAIQPESSFLRLGGDSIAAMRLTAVARDGNLRLTVQSILDNPRLSDMAKSMTDLSPEIDSPEPFSLLQRPGDKDATLTYVSQTCGVDALCIEDVFPCTGVQKSLLSMTAKADGSYIARFQVQLKDEVDVDRLMSAWDKVSRGCAASLRTRIVDDPSQGLVQVQLREALTWDLYGSVGEYLERDGSKPMGLGQPLTRLAIVREEGGRALCLITQHHAIYDGYSLDLLLTQVSRAYRGMVDDRPVAPFQAFIKHVLSVDAEEAKEYWRDQFEDLEAVPFPPLPEQDYHPKADSTVRHVVEGIQWPGEDATASTIIRAAWSILTARYVDAQDVVFGAMVTGRQAPIFGIDSMIAPLINAVPVRVKLDPTQTVEALLHVIQRQSTSMIRYEQTELLDIRRIDANSERASRFNTLLVVQPASQSSYTADGDGPFRHRPQMAAGEDLDNFNPNAVMIMCQLTATHDVHLEMSFDSHVISVSQMQRMAAQLEHVLRQICASTSQTIEDIDVLSPRDVEEMWEWNATVPATIEECVHEMIGKTARRQPQAQAICAWDGNLSYAELSQLSDDLASHLVSLGVGAGDIIPLCFEKSMWYPVAALGAMKAGAACVAMDSTQPESRLRSIVQQMDPRILLSSASNEALARRLSEASVVVVGGSQMECYKASDCALPQVDPSDVLYVVFTSGSTGVPKGIVTTHQNFASAATHQAEILHIGRETRVFDFVSYSFDVSWSNHLQTLIRGGCLCIPSEWERKNDIAGAFNRLNCDYSYLTPSVAQSQDPAAMPGLRTLAMGGEPIRASEVARWTQAETIIGIYGPAECAQALSFARLSPTTPNGHVGKPYGAKTWLVQPGRPDRLAAIGTVAELVIEGPTVSRGYFRDADRTAAAYLQDPAWLLRGSRGHPGRRGTLYRTGDLLRLNGDGSADFIGRKDGMIKLRGQRIELAEVEYHVRCSLGDASLCRGIAAEIIVPKESSSPLLAVFLSMASDVNESEEERRSEFLRAIDGVEEKMLDSVPQYMVPGAYIPLDKIPMTTTNKTDRRKLRELGAAQTLDALAELQSHRRERRSPSTAMEKRLQALWSRVLSVDPASISADSSFLRVGGESIAAMRLVSAAREQGLSLTVADIFTAPRLSALALRVKTIVPGEGEQQQQPPFALVNTDDPRAFVDSLVIPSLAPGLVVADVYPATDFQDLAVTEALQDPPGRLPHWIFMLPSDVDFARLQRACMTLVSHYDILRTVFVRAKDRLWQVLLAHLTPEYDHLDAGNEDLATFTDAVCEQDLRRPRALGASLVRFFAIQHASGRHRLVFRLSHAQFDGYSWSTVLQTLSSIYADEPLSPPPRFGDFIAFIEAKREESMAYWRRKLQGSTAPNLTRSAPPANNVRVAIKETLKMPRRLGDIPPATVFHAACAVALSRQFHQRDVVFGRLVTGRSTLPAHLQDVVGPCMAEIPVRVTVEETDSVDDVAARLHETFLEDAAHEGVGMARIVGECWAGAEDFGWRTAFQQEEDGGDEFVFLRQPSAVSFYDKQMVARRRPEVYATPKGGELVLEYEGASGVVDEAVVGEVLGRLKGLLDD